MVQFYEKTLALYIEAKDVYKRQGQAAPQGAEESPSQPVAAVGIISVHELRSQ